MADIWTPVDARNDFVEVQRALDAVEKMRTIKSVTAPSVEELLMQRLQKERIQGNYFGKGYEAGQVWMETASVEDLYHLTEEFPFMGRSGVVYNALTMRNDPVIGAAFAKTFVNKTCGPLVGMTRLTDFLASDWLSGFISGIRESV